MLPRYSNAMTVLLGSPSPAMLTAMTRYSHSLPRSLFVSVIWLSTAKPCRRRVNPIVFNYLLPVQRFVTSSDMDRNNSILQHVHDGVAGLSFAGFVDAMTQYSHSLPCSWPVSVISLSTARPTSDQGPRDATGVGPCRPRPRRRSALKKDAASCVLSP